ncbi:BTB/POZ domain-containing protein [Ditylenchus destructor]|nr:BTB/POZ domain-containing protein [Ditylenchus destructor]
MFSLSLPTTVIWKLNVFPHGSNDNPASDNPYFHLLMGFQTSDGSLSTDGTKSINADYKIYLLSSTNEESIVKQALSEFKVGTSVGSYMSAEEAKKFIDPDGSLLVICEVECLVPKKTLSMEPTSNLHLTAHIGKMWKSQLFTDCTIKVGGKSFRAHKGILGQWSEVFCKMFSPPTKEAESGIVEIEDFGADSISTMLEYMYTGVVKDKVMEKLAPELLALANKYDACFDRLPMDGPAVVQSKGWEEFKNKNKDLANELLELMIKDHPNFVKVQAKPEKAKPQKTRNRRHQSISSKTFILPHLQAVWQLDVTPRGQDGIQNLFCFNLRLLGFQALDGSLSTDRAEGIMAAYKIYLLSSANVKEMVSLRAYVFNTGTAHGSYKYDVTKFIHPDGSLLVICEIESKASEETFSTEPRLNPALLDQKLHLTGHVKEMWKSQLFADCTLKVGPQFFPAHKCILGQWSEVFRRMFLLPTEEAASGVVEIMDFSPEAISAMLEYMYTGVVKNEVMEKQAVELLTLSDKYAVIPLKEMCEVFLASKLTTTNVLEATMFADRYSAAKLKKACVNRLAIEGQAVLQSKEWEDLKSNDKDAANELLELMIKDQPSFVDVLHK